MKSHLKGNHDKSAPVSDLTGRDPYRSRYTASGIHLAPTEASLSGPTIPGFLVCLCSDTSYSCNTRPTNASKLTIADENLTMPQIARFLFLSAPHTRTHTERVIRS
ncbi:hypothetical protein HGRIS_014249 [Hohenbuehelia grisea]|uniref:Uncharacterized protein n=1 Tax=Hohenbuehelia grisea TaxID=104357 RepID=A0ABR3JUW4_9AGAR